MQYAQLIFTGHAVAQMFQRGISQDAVRHVIHTGETIADYKDDTPYPSMLLLGYHNAQSLHVVYAYDAPLNTGYVITAYRPDPAIWTEDNKRRK